MTKNEIVKEIYIIQNRINVLKGKPENNLEDRQMLWKMNKEADQNSKPNLSIQLESIQKTHSQLISQIENEKKIAKFYATPEGVKIKQAIETTIQNKIEEWKNYDKQTVKELEKLIQTNLGEHWGVVHFNKGFVEIGIIDKEKSTSERREYYFGQSISLCYEVRSWLSKDNEDKYETNVGSCGSFDIEGRIIGERAMFYVGLGKFLDNPQLTQAVKNILQNSISEMERMGEKLDKLRKQLAHPILIENTNTQNNNTKTQNHGNRKLHI